MGAYWALEVNELVTQLHSTADGLSAVEAEARLRDYGPNTLGDHRPLSRTSVLLGQFRSPFRSPAPCETEPDPVGFRSLPKHQARDLSFMQPRG